MKKQIISQPPINNREIDNKPKVRKSPVQLPPYTITNDYFDPGVKEYFHLSF